MGNPTGVASLNIAGDDWNCVKSSCQASRPKREILPSQTEVGDYSENPQTGKIKVTVRPSPDQDSTALANITGDSCILTERSGVVWYGDGLVQTGEAEYDTAEGTMDLVFEGTVTRDTAS